MNGLIHVTIGGREGSFAPGIRVCDAVQALLPERAPQVLCTLRGGVGVELGETLQKDTALKTLTYRDEEGRRVYERSLRFLFLLSLKRLYPGKHVRMMHSVGHGLYMRLTDGDMGHDMARAIEADMRSLAAQDLPFEKEIWTRVHY